MTSSRRFKDDIEDMGDASAALLRLRPVTFHYKQAAEGTVEYGLIAEEVARVYPDLVVRDAEGRIQTVQYQKLAPMLLNELQKMKSEFEQKLAAEQERNRQLEARLAALESALRK
jgi:hypothetical protein